MTKKRNPRKDATPDPADAADAVPAETDADETSADVTDADVTDAGDAEADSDAGAPEIALPERCGVSVAHDLAEAGQTMEPGGRIVIAAGEVGRMSCAAVVALISLAKTAALTEGRVVIRAPSAAFTDAFSHLGLFDSLMSMEFAE